MAFNQPPIALSFFTGGGGEKPQSLAEIENRNIIMSTLRTLDDGVMIRLYNSAEVSQKTKISFEKFYSELTFNPYEAKTFVFKDGKMEETNMLGEKSNQ